LTGDAPAAPRPAAHRWPSPEVRRAFAPLIEDPAHSAIVSDFDGTLSPIVTDPAAARALDGTADLLALLARRFGVVAVVSGRPASFLVEQLAHTDRGRPVDGGAGSTGVAHGLRLVGLYGLEWAGQDGAIIREPEAEQWRSTVEGAVRRLRSAAPPGVVVEGKGLAVTVHWRQAPQAEEWAAGAVASESERSGLRAHPGRMSIELRPALAVDKGSVTRSLVEGYSAACYLGDDLGDLPAFAALADLTARAGLSTVSVAVVDAESDPAVIEAADLTVSGPDEALAVLEWLAVS
jgi:trehalose 6-phosphate phosphatase